MTSVAHIDQDQAFASGAVSAQDRVDAASLDSQVAAIKNKINEALTALAVLIGDDNTLEDGVVRSVNLHPEVVASLANLDFLQSVEVATTGNIALSGLLTIDGYTVIAGSRVLVRSQSDSTENGIYVAAAGAWARASDASAGTALEAETSVYVENGTVHGLATFKLSADATIGEAHTWRRIGGAASGARAITRGGTGSSSAAAWPTYYRRRARAVGVANVSIVAPGATLDGVTLVNGDRILLTAQTTGNQNGLWVWRGAAALLERAVDYPSTSADHAFQDLVVEIGAGTTYSGTFWRCTTAGAIVIDTTTTAWTEATPYPQRAGGTGATTLAAATLIATGATASRSLAARFRDVINVLDHGATGLGILDDSAAIQAALNLADAAGGGTVYFPAGTYLLTAKVTAYSNTTIIGAGAATLLTFSRLQLVGDATYGGSMITWEEDSSNVIVRDLRLVYTGTFDSGSTYGGKVCGLHLNNASQVLIDNVEASGWNHSAIMLLPTTIANLTRCQDVTIRNCKLHDNRVSGFWFANVDGLRIVDSEFYNNGLATDPDTGYGIAGEYWQVAANCARNVVVRGCRVFNNKRTGIDFHQGEDLLIDGNQVYADQSTTLKQHLNAHVYIGEIYGKITVRGNTIKGTRGNALGGLYIPAGIKYGNGTTVNTSAVDLIIANNEIDDYDMASTGSAGAPIYGQNNAFTKLNAIVVGNIIRVTKANQAIGSNDAGTTVPTYNRWTIFGNILHADTVSNTLVSLANVTHLRFEGNTCFVGAGTSNQYAVAVTANTGSGAPYPKIEVLNNDLSYTTGGTWTAPAIYKDDYVSDTINNTINQVRQWNAYYTGDGTTHSRIQESHGTAAPVTGSWSRGSRVWNVTPSAAGVPGWVCVTAGTPGTWKAMAVVAA